MGRLATVVQGAQRQNIFEKYFNLAHVCKTNHWIKFLSDSQNSKDHGD